MPEKYGAGIIHASVKLQKHSGGRYIEVNCMAKFKSLFCNCCRTWRTRYFTVTDESVFYTLHKKTFLVKQLLTFSSHFKVVFGLLETGNDLGIILESTYRRLELKAQKLYEFTIFISAVLESLNASIYFSKQRYNSFASIRQNCFSKYYIDGQFYFSQLCDEISKAQKNVYITDWMLSPYFQLKRPSQLDNTATRLDSVLENIAKKGVKVNIILYLEPKIALNNDSEYVQFYFEELSKNIKVLRHPKYILIPFLWSHHQKMVIIDQKCAFMGGLDLCYGRWDTQKHHLHNNNQLWKGADFCNFRISDIYNPRNFQKSNLNEKIQPRMPWHDIAIQIRGLSVTDLTRHFVQYWNFVRFQTKFNQKQLLINSGHHHQNHERNQTFFFKKKKKKIQQILMSQQETEEDVDKQTQYYEQFMETGLKRFLDLDHITENIKENFNQIRKYPKKLYKFILEGEDNEEDRLLFNINNSEKNRKKGHQKHQILRSASTWSLGLRNQEYQRSIYQAYIDLINSAKQFIYIQNQFFICQKNIIAELLANKILHAHAQKKKFKVIIMLPLLPGFEGQVDEPKSAVMRVQLNWEYQTIARGKKSLLSRLSSISNIDDYLQILSLRKHDLLQANNPATQILYIHSKLMIVDDQKVILGSANINDRSLWGKRDSEIGIVVEEQTQVHKMLQREISSSAHQLRCNLYEQHFSLTFQQAQNYHNQQTWQLIKKKAKTNTELYRKIFGCYPDNKMKTYKDIAEIKKNADITRYQELKSVFNGNVVEWPCYFLEKQNLALKISQKEYFVPEINFT